MGIEKGCGLYTKQHNVFGSNNLIGQYLIYLIFRKRTCFTEIENFLITTFTEYIIIMDKKMFYGERKFPELRNNYEIKISSIIIIIYLS